MSLMSKILFAILSAKNPSTLNPKSVFKLKTFPIEPDFNSSFNFKYIGMVLKT